MGFIRQSLAATPLAAQTTVYSTFGPADAYVTGVGYTISSASSAVGMDYSFASRFQYGGPGSDVLSSIRVAAFKVAGNGAFVDFLQGASIGSATLLETWTLSTSTPYIADIFSLQSVLNPMLGSGEFYWVRMRADAGTWWAWNWNSEGIEDLTAVSQDGGQSRDENEGRTAPAYDVSVGQSSVVPEPSTYALMATGLLALAVIRRRQRASRASSNGFTPGQSSSVMP